MCDAYDIIDWQSCGTSSLSSAEEAEDEEEEDDIDFDYRPYTEDYSTTDIVFPTLFHERHATTTSIDTIPELEQSDECGPLSYLDANLPQDVEQSVYHKVAHWVLTQRRFFQKSDIDLVDDDDIEVIDPVDLFHESVLDQYHLLTGNTSRLLLTILSVVFSSFKFRQEGLLRG